MMRGVSLASGGAEMVTGILDEMHDKERKRNAAYCAVRNDLASLMAERPKMSHFEGSKLYQYGPFR